MKRELISDIYRSPECYDQKQITVAGWARSIRASNEFGFADLNDGSYFSSLQVVLENQKLENYAEITSLNVGAAIIVTGTLVLTPGAKQPFELKAEKVEVEGTSTPDYPLQKKRHTVEYLREIAYLRPRTNLFSAVFRVRSETAYAIHSFFHIVAFGFLLLDMSIP